MKEKEREGGRKRQKPISQQGGQVANYGAEYNQSSLSGFQAECTMLLLRNHFGHPLHCPIQNVLSSLALAIEQPSHNSPELWNWLTASVSLSLSLSDLCASAETAEKWALVWPLASSAAPPPMTTQAVHLRSMPGYHLALDLSRWGKYYSQ